MAEKEKEKEEKKEEKADDSKGKKDTKTCACGDETKNERGVCNTCKVIDEKEEGLSIDTKKKPPVGGILLIIILAVALVVSIATNGFTTLMPAPPITPIDQEMSVVLQDTIKYVNTNLIPPEVNATYLGGEDVSGVYRFTLQIGGQQFNSFVTKDGKWIFPDGINTSQSPQQPIQQSVEEATQ